MRTLLIFRNHYAAILAAEEFGLKEKEYGYLPSKISSKDILTHSSIRGERYDRVIYDIRPSSLSLAFISLSMRDGAILTNYNNYKLTQVLNKL